MLGIRGGTLTCSFLHMQLVFGYCKGDWWYALTQHYHLFLNASKLLIEFFRYRPLLLGGLLFEGLGRL